MKTHQNLVENIFSNESFIAPAELREEIQAALLRDEISLESPLQDDYNFWKKIGAKTPAEKIAHAKSSFEKIIQLFAGEEYKDYMWYLTGSGSDVKEGNGFLYNDVMKKIASNDSELPELMYVMISFFDRVSKLPEAKQKELLAQFPMTDQNDYNCDGGTQNRLRLVILQIENDLVQSFNNTIVEATSKLVHFTGIGNQAHIPSLLQKSLGFKSHDKLWHAPSTEIPAGEIWEFVQSYNQKLAEKFNSVQEQNREEKQKSISQIAEAFDTIINILIPDKNISLSSKEWAAFEQAIKPHLKALGFSTLSALAQHFFDFNDDSDITKLKKSPDSDKTLIELKLEELAKQSEIKIQEEPRLEFELHDVDAYQKIAVILQNQDSTAHQKNIAIEALWILSQNFPNNSLINFIKAVNEIGTDNLKIILTNHPHAQEILGRIEAKIKTPLWQKIIKNETLSARENIIDLEIPAAYLEQIRTSLELRPDFIQIIKSIDAQDLLKLIFYHPKRNDILDILAAPKIDQNLLDGLLFLAAEKQDAKFTRFLIEKGANVRRTDQRGNLPLHSAVLNGDNEDLIKILLEAGDKKGVVFGLFGKPNIANVNNADGENALRVAAQYGRAKSTGLLLSKMTKSAVNQEYAFIGSALHVAGQYGHAGVITELLKFPGIDISKRNHRSLNPLDTAAYHNKSGAVKAFVETMDPFQINAQSKFGTAIYMAADFGHSEVMKVLAANEKVDPNIGFIDNNTPLYNAAMKGDAKIVKILAECPRVEIDKTYRGRTPLSVAVEKQHLEAFIELLVHGANPALIDKRGHAKANISGSTSEDIKTILEPITDLQRAFDGTPGLQGKISVRVCLQGEIQKPFLVALTPGEDLIKILEEHQDQNWIKFLLDSKPENSQIKSLEGIKISEGFLTIKDHLPPSSKVSGHEGNKVSGETQGIAAVQA